MKELHIKGYTVLLDDEDYERVAHLKWWVDKSNLKNKGLMYFYHKFTDSDGRKFNQSMHRFILGLEHKDGFLGDHINGNTLDNRKCNLRKCTVAENTQNAKIHKDNLTGYKGVSWSVSGSNYRARICVNNKQRILGYFPTPEEAYEAYCKASKELHGEFGRV